MFKRRKEEKQMMETKGSTQKRQECTPIKRKSEITRNYFSTIPSILTESVCFKDYVPYTEEYLPQM